LSIKIADIRLLNLKSLISRYDSRLDFALKVGYPDTGYLNQMLTSHSAIGNSTAAKICEKLDLQEGWLDIPRPSLWGEDGTSAVEVMSDMADGMTNDELALVISELAMRLAKSNK